MTKKSGTAGTIVSPVAPSDAQEADVADPGVVEEIKAEQRQLQTGKYGQVKAPPFKPETTSSPTTSDSTQPAEEEKKKTWVEIQLNDQSGKPIAGEPYEVKMPDGSVASGTTDEKGVARIEGFDPGSCEVKFPGLENDQWKPA